ncbi:3-oxoacyl-[acyl-carrier-protein] reductase FabG [compost metagenome]
MHLLNNRVIFLTGGSKGIGLECAMKYAEEGAKLAIVSNDQASINHALSILGKQHLGLLADVSIAHEIQYAIDETQNKFGKIDVIHNNAGIANPSKAIHETQEVEWNDLFNINVKGIYHTSKYGIEALIASKGCIINTSSLVGEIGQENHAVYAATKGAVNALTKSMALDYAKYKIRVNAVAPAGVWTEMLEEWGKVQGDIDGIKNYLDGIHALGYCPNGDVVADACVFLASEKARFITGIIMHVSGGAELGYKKVNQLETF